jgi:hypothetical protein
MNTCGATCHPRLSTPSHGEPHVRSGGRRTAAPTGQVHLGGDANPRSLHGLRRGLGQNHGRNLCHAHLTRTHTVYASRHPAPPGHALQSHLRGLLQPALPPPARRRPLLTVVSSVLRRPPSGRRQALQPRGPQRGRLSDRANPMTAYANYTPGWNINGGVTVGAGRAPPR